MEIRFCGGAAFTWDKCGTERAVNYSGCVGYVTCLVQTAGAYTVWWANLRERDHLEDLRVNERIMLQWILKILNWLWLWTSGGLFWIR